MPDALTWSALLAKWTEFAQSVVALPENEEGDRWRDAAAPIITLQACANAMGDLDELSSDERLFGLDKAEILIQRSAKQLHALWTGEPLPHEITEIIDDARRARSAAAGRGLEWIVADERLIAPHPGDLQTVLASADFSGDLMLPTPGVPLFEGAPCAFLRGRMGEIPADELIEVIEAYLSTCDGEWDGPEAVAGPRQVYRQFDFAAGGPVRDLVAPMDRDLPAGQPQLMPAIESGDVLPVPLPIRGADQVRSLPVEQADEPGSAQAPS